MIGGPALTKCVACRNNLSAGNEADHLIVIGVDKHYLLLLLLTCVGLNLVWMPTHEVRTIPERHPGNSHGSASLSGAFGAKRSQATAHSNALKRLRGAVCVSVRARFSHAPCFGRAQRGKISTRRGECASTDPTIPISLLNRKLRPITSVDH